MKESALWLMDNFPSLKCNNHKEGEGLFFLSVYIFLNLLKSKGQSQTVKAGPRRSEDRQACRSPGRRASGGTRASSLGVSFRVVGPLGYLSAQPTCRQRAECGRARGWEWGPLEGRSLLPDPGVSTFPNADAHHLSSETIRFPAGCALPCAVCVRVRVEAGRVRALGCTREPLGLAPGGSLHQAEKQVKSPRGDWWEWCALHGPRWGVFCAHVAAGGFSLG